MSFAQELKSASKKVIEDHALTTSIKIQSKLKEFAMKGHTECFMEIPNEYADIILNADYIDLLKDLLDGVNVEVVERSISPLLPSFLKKEVRFSW